MLSLDPSTGSLTVPLWVLAVVLAVLVAMTIFAIARAGAARTVLGLIGIVILGYAGWVGWALLDRSAASERAAEHRAFEQRAAALAANGRVPGQALACLGGMAGEQVESACERAVFATPDSSRRRWPTWRRKWRCSSDALDASRPRRRITTRSLCLFGAALRPTATASSRMCCCSRKTAPPISAPRWRCCATPITCAPTCRKNRSTGWSPSMRQAGRTRASVRRWPTCRGSLLGLRGHRQAFRFPRSTISRPRPQFRRSTSWVPNRPRGAAAPVRQPPHRRRPRPPAHQHRAGGRGNTGRRCRRAAAGRAPTGRARARPRVSRCAAAGAAAAGTRRARAGATAIAIGCCVTRIDFHAPSP